MEQTSPQVWSPNFQWHVVRSPQQYLPVAALDVFLPGAKTLGQSAPRRWRWWSGDGTPGLPCRGGPTAGRHSAGAGRKGSAVSGAGDVCGEGVGIPTTSVGRAVSQEVSTPPVAVDQPGRGATPMEAPEGWDTSDCYGEAMPCLAGSGWRSSFRMWSERGLWLFPTLIFFESLCNDPSTWKNSMIVCVYLSDSTWGKKQTPGWWGIKSNQRLSEGLSSYRSLPLQIQIISFAWSCCKATYWPTSFGKIPMHMASILILLWGFPFSDCLCFLCGSFSLKLSLIRPKHCWMVCPPFRGSCLPLSPIVSAHVCLCRMVLSPPSCAIVSNWRRVRCPEVLFPSSPSLSVFLFPFVASGLILHVPNSVLVGLCLPIPGTPWKSRK